MSGKPQFDAVSGLWVGGPWLADARRPSPSPNLAQRLKRWWKAQRTESPEDILVYGGAADGRQPIRFALPLVSPIVLIMLVLVVREPENASALAAAWFGAAALLYGAVAALIEARRGPSFWSQLLHCVVYSGIITGLLTLLLLVEHPRMHAHWIVFFLYFLLIGAMGLARDPRIAVASGAASIIGYLCAHLAVHDAARSGVPIAMKVVGEFEWMASSAKVAILAGMTLTATASARRGLVVRRLSIRDPLTGLLNRGAFDVCLDLHARTATRGAHPLAIAMIDIDHFKALNDACGHLAGDAVLTWLSGWLRRSVRETDLVARYGGEEFVVAFVDSDHERLDERLEAWRRAIAASVVRPAGSDAEIRLAVSIGIARFPADASSPIAALARADGRLYQAKRAGRNRVTA